MGKKRFYEVRSKKPAWNERLIEAVQGPLVVSEDSKRTMERTGKAKGLAFTPRKPKK